MRREYCVWSLRKITRIGSRNAAEKLQCSPSTVAALSANIYEDEVNWGVIKENLHVDQSTIFRISRL